jgi:hypothetical protein
MQTSTCTGLGCDIEISDSGIIVKDGIEAVTNTSDLKDWLNHKCDYILSENIHRIINEFHTPSDLIAFIKKHVLKTVR